MSKERIRVNVWISRDHWRALRQLAAIQETSQGQVIERLVDVEVKRLRQDDRTWLNVPLAAG